MENILLVFNIIINEDDMLDITVHDFFITSSNKNPTKNLTCCNRREKGVSLKQTEE